MVIKAPIFPNSQLQLQLVTASGKLPIRYHNVFRMVIQVIILSLSLWYFGYNLVQISCLPKAVLVSAFSNHMSNAAILGLLICLITVGCMFGTISSSYLVNRISLKKFLLMTNVFAVIVGGVVQVPNIYALGVCRFFEGVTAGFYMQIIPVYISQITPKQIGWMFSHWPQILVVLGVDSAYIFQLIFTAGNVDQQPYWRAIFAIPIGVVLLQSVLVIIFVQDSPYVHLREKQFDEAKEIFLKFYKEEYINEVIKEKIKEIYCLKVVMMSQDEYYDYKQELSLLTQLEQKKITQQGEKRNSNIQQFLTKQPQKSPQRMKSARQSFQQDSFEYEARNQQQIQELHLLRNKYTPAKAVLGFIIAQSLHMTGILAIVTQAGEIQKEFDANIGKITPVSITTVQLILTLASIFVIKGMGTLLNVVLCLAVMGLNSILNGVFFIFIHWSPAISITFAILLINMIVFGSGLGNSVGIAMGELLHPKLIPYAAAISWLGASFCIVILPIVMDALNRNGYPALFFFGGWSLISSIIIVSIGRKLKLL